jgi:hypothetical protein
VQLIANIFSPALELLDLEVYTWECVSSSAIDRLKSSVKILGLTPFPPEKPDHRALLHRAHLTLKSVENSSKIGKVDDELDEERSNEHD